MPHQLSTSSSRPTTPVLNGRFQALWRFASVQSCSIVYGSWIRCAFAQTWRRKSIATLPLADLALFFRRLCSGCRRALAAPRCYRWASTQAEASFAQDEQQKPLPATAGSPEEVTEAGDSSEADPSVPSSAFSGMKGVITYDVWKAITVRPFKHTNMSPVQEAVLRLLPELAGPVQTQPQNGSEGESSQEAPKDLLVKARTGTGKTLAFLVPAIQARINELRTIAKGVPGVVPKAIAGQQRRDQSKQVAGAVILSPTRELATQIAAESEKLGTHVKEFETQLFVGGASKGQQIKQFKRGRKDVVVATPGRLLDLLSDDSTGVARALENVRTVIFDEADTLLDMGFKDEIDRILEYLPPKEQRQTFLFSATVSPEIRTIAKKSLKPDHLFIDTVPKNEVNLHQHVPQYATVLPTPSQQLPHLIRLLLHDSLANPNGKAIVFLPTTKLTKLFAQILITLKPFMGKPRDTMIHEIHSQLTQSRRDRSSDKFRAASKGYNILVTSDVSARGVDYPGVTRVIQLGERQLLMRVSVRQS